MASENIDFVTDTNLNSETHLFWPAKKKKKKKKKCRERTFSSYFKTRVCYIEPVEKTVGCNYKTGKLDQLKPSFVAV